MTSSYCTLMKFTLIGYLIQITTSHTISTYTGVEDDYMEEKIEEIPEISSNTFETFGRKRNCTADTAIIDKLLNGTGYNKFRVPGEEKGVDVAVEFWLQAITSISEITNDFQMDIYINEMWLDPYLNFEHLSPCKHNLSLNGQVLDRLWTPNSCFINSKVAEIHESPFKNVFLMLYPNGTVWVNYRVRVRGPCSMELTNFPLDTQRCGLIYESFNYNNQEVRMRWNPLNVKPVTILNEILLPDYDLVNIETKHIEEQYPAGMWDELHITFIFKRRFVWYFMQAYVPTYLTIFISWVSFALGSKAIPARTMLGVNSLLAIVFQFGNIMRNLPRVSYIKAIDVWMLGSMTFIFGTLIELAIVGYKVREGDTSSRKKPMICRQRQNDNEVSPQAFCGYEKRFMFPVEKLDIKWKAAGCCRMRWTPDEIDKISSCCFPTFFALFNVCYWSYYLY